MTSLRRGYMVALNLRIWYFNRHPHSSLTEEHLSRGQQPDPGPMGLTAISSFLQLWHLFFFMLLDELNQQLDVSWLQHSQVWIWMPSPCSYQAKFSVHLLSLWCYSCLWTQSLTTMNYNMEVCRLDSWTHSRYYLVYYPHPTPLNVYHLQFHHLTHE